MRLSLAQIDSGTDKVRNLALVGDFARRAADDGADLVAFPEYSMYEKKVVDASFGPAAEPLDGPFVTGVSSLAARLGITIAVGVVEKNGDESPFNSIVVIDPAGLSRHATARSTSSTRTAFTNRRPSPHHPRSSQ